MSKGAYAAESTHAILVDVEREVRAAQLLVHVSGCRLLAARRALTELGGLASVLMASELELSRCGLLPPQIGRLRAAGELAREYRAFHRDGRSAGHAQDVFDMLSTEAWIYAEQENFFVFALNIRNRLLGCSKVAVGSVHGVEIGPREVFRVAIRQNASGVVLAHNHPSGDQTPSEKDVDLTRRMVEAGRLVGIPVVDHVVVSANGFVSILERHEDIFK